MIIGNGTSYEFAFFGWENIMMYQTYRYDGLFFLSNCPWTNMWSWNTEMCASTENTQRDTPYIDNVVTVLRCAAVWNTQGVQYPLRLLVPELYIGGPPSGCLQYVCIWFKEDRRERLLLIGRGKCNEPDIRLTACEMWFGWVVVVLCQFIASRTFPRVRNPLRLLVLGCYVPYTSTTVFI